MELGIIGLPQSGKTTLFNALTGGRAQAASHPQGDKANLGVVKVPDQRLETLTKLFTPKKTVPAEVTYLDFPRVLEDLGKGQGIGGEYLNRLQGVDALLHAVRAFEDPSVPHIIEGGVDPYRDVATMDMELAFSDLGILDKRLQRLETGLKGAKAQEQETIHRERTVLERIKVELEKEVPIRALTLGPQEIHLLENYQFLTAKPLLVALNIGENQLSQAPSIEGEMASRIEGPFVRGTVICGKLEMELSQMEEEDEKEFRESLGAGESGLKRIIQLSYDVLGTISFFTVVHEEVRAWAITRGSTALKAAGKIHSDMERGFIRAEVISFDDLVSCGSTAEARKLGILRLGGKSYPVQDGDVITFLFNV